MKSELEKCVDGVAGSIRNSVGIRMVDALTEVEVDELRILVDAPKERRVEIFRKHVENPEIRDMYLLFGELEYIDCTVLANGGIVFDRITHKASWALARYDERMRREEEERTRHERERKADRKWSVVTVAIGAIIGGVIGVFATVAGQVLLRFV